MIESLIQTLEPIQSTVIDLSVAIVGILSTLACFIPSDTKLGRALRKGIEYTKKAPGLFKKK